MQFNFISSWPCSCTRVMHQTPSNAKFVFLTKNSVQNLPRGIEPSGIYILTTKSSLFTQPHGTLFNSPTMIKMTEKKLHCLKSKTSIKIKSVFVSSLIILKVFVTQFGWGHKIYDCISLACFVACSEHFFIKFCDANKQTKERTL